jgi:hypothetical protein
VLNELPVRVQCTVLVGGVSAQSHAATAFTHQLVLGDFRVYGCCDCLLPCGLCNHIIDYIQTDTVLLTAFHS